MGTVVVVVGNDVDVVMTSKIYLAENKLTEWMTSLVLDLLFEKIITKSTTVNFNVQF